MNISDVSIEEITLKSGVKSELIYFLVRSLFDRENNQANGSGGSRDDSWSFGVLFMSKIGC